MLIQPKNIYLGKDQSIVLSLLIFSAFGPYVSDSFGLRFDHLIIYPLMLIYLPKMLLQKNFLKSSTTSKFILFCLILVLIWTSTVTLLTPRGMSLFKITASAENYLQPLAIVLLSLIAISQNELQSPLGQLEKTCFIICVFLCTNTIISVAEIFIDTWPLVKYFVRGETQTGLSVWHNAVSMGRYSGIFNQPMEAGLAYSVGIISWIYWIRSRKRRGFPSVILFSFLFTGGLLTVSKVFVLGGIPICLFYLTWTSSYKIYIRRKTILSLFLLACLFAIYYLFLFDIWEGKDYLLRLFGGGIKSHSGFLSLYTAGRFGSSGSWVKHLFGKTWEEAPLQGFGFGVMGPIDNGYLEFFYQGGIVCLVLYVFILLSIFYHAIKFYRISKKECKLLLVLFIIILFSGLGAPILTLNRSSIFLWILLVLSLEVSDGKETCASMRDCVE